MGDKVVRVLLIGESGTDFSRVFEHLEEQGCECKLASSYAEATKLFAEKHFDLVLCHGQPGIRTLLSSVAGSAASVFCAHSVEDGCWWLPAMKHGKECLGTPALHPSEFRALLEQILTEYRSSARDRAAGAT